MEIKSLTLFSKQPKKLKAFYKEIIGFKCQDITNGFEIITLENRLQFEKSDQEFYYHFAFLIPTGSIEDAIRYLETRSIELLPYKEKKIIEFDTGRSIYFYDPDGNIGEFIERPLLEYPQSSTFSIDKVIKLNEIGLPHHDPIKVSNDLMNTYNIAPINASNFGENFCWVGDHNGVIIVTKEGRNWLPTNKPGIVNDFIIEYSDSGKNHKLSFENNSIYKYF
ncbi:hypothetical protein [Aquimarina sp. 2201CG5-10]|uniref:VOC family protein n=1 Tax=Aquimarina callyspongiae TaxID=3098150 RepID=UPI002AB441FE|nr:hypothetical protein [Aquimarina sp. 2201CG5-10]MDY8135587.1 hypothetical protein [Aquimarina sp. 2201CG5-10]